MAKTKVLNRSPIVLEVIHNGNVINTSSTGGNGTSSNVTFATTDRGYQSQHGTYNGTNASTTFASAINSTRGCYFRIYPTANNKTVLQLVTTTALITISAGGAITTTGVSNAVVYVDGVQTTTVILNKWNDVYISWDSFNCSNFAIGLSSFAGNIGRVMLLNAVLSLSEIQDWYKEGLRQLSGHSLGSLMDGLVEMYDFRGDANGIISGSNGTLQNSPSLTTDRFGNSKGYAFNGSTQYMSATIPTINTDFTLSFWYYRAGNGTGSNPLILGAGNAFASGFTINEVAASKKFACYYSTQNIFFEPGSALVDNTWEHVTYTKIGTAFALYRNGVSVATTTNATSFSSSTSFQIAKRLSSGEYWNGRIDDIIIKNKGLSSSEVLILYNLNKDKYLLPFA